MWKSILLLYIINTTTRAEIEHAYADNHLVMNAENIHRIISSPLKVEDIATTEDVINKGIINPSLMTSEVVLDATNTQRRVSHKEDAEASTTDGSLSKEMEANRTIEKFKSLYPINKWKEGGFFTEDYLKLINIHWLEFPPPPRTAHYILGGVYVIFAMVGAGGNLLVIFMFIKCRSLRTPANILVFNLAISDFLLILKTPIFIYNSAYLGPALGSFGCQIYGFVGGLTGTVSIGTLAAIAFDRYSVVVYPLEPLRSMSGLRAKISVIFVWIYGAFFAAIPVFDFGLGRYVPEGYLTSCSFDYLSEDSRHKLFIFVFFCAAWLMPLIVISFCYANILHVVMTTRNLGKGADSSIHCKENEKRKTELRLAGVVIGVIALFFIAWTPYAIVSLLGIFGQKYLIKPLISMVPALFCKSASCIDPFVYVLTHPKFKQECCNLMMPGARKEKRRRSTVKHWSIATNKTLPPEQEEKSSDDGVEEVEMGKMAYKEYDDNLQKDSDASSKKAEAEDQSTHIVIKGVSMTELPKSFESNPELKPPSWFVKPQFDSQRGSSLKKVVKTLQKMTSEDKLPT